jgi:flagellar hook-associated protein 1 FlgK
MSGLFTSLGMAARALDAQRMGLDVAGQNVANVNTPGYARRTLDLASVPAATAASAGGGVGIEGIRAIRDRFLERRVEQEIPAEHREAAVAEMLEVVEAALGRPGASVDARLSEMFGAFSRLADAPTSAVARDDVINQAQQLVRSFQDVDRRLVDAQQAAETRARATLTEVNAIAARLAALNRAYGSTGSGTGALSLHDQQSTLVRQLSELVDVDVLERPGGGVDVTVGSGRALVIGELSFELTAQPLPPAGLSTILVDGRDITAEISGGRLAGTLAARDTAIPDYRRRLDELAVAVATEVNAVHATGFDLTGNAGGDFFSFGVPPVGATGAAAAIRLNPAVAADGRRIAAAGVALAGDNTVARALAGLRDARVLGGGTATLVDGWSQLLYRVGRDTRTAQDERASRAAIVQQVESLREQVSGVSLDEEAAHLMKFQRAYEANARYFRIIDETLGTLMGLVR